MPVSNGNNAHPSFCEVRIRITDCQLSNSFFPAHLAINSAYTTIYSCCYTIAYLLSMCIFTLNFEGLAGQRLYAKINCILPVFIT